MRRKIFYALATIIVAAATLGAVANGPYYALPAWSQKLACAVGNCPRFIVLSDWNSEAVLDRETGLVWEKSPGNTQKKWESAHHQCNNLSVGNRKGWRLPAVQELMSLIDPSIATQGLFTMALLPAAIPFKMCCTATTTLIGRLLPSPTPAPSASRFSWASALASRLETLRT